MSAFAKRIRLLTGVVSILLLLALMGGAWFYHRLRSSLPQLDGTRNLPGLSSSVTITRDALGVPTVRGATRIDVARAFGFVHAQDRFFQMDLLRRRAAGELAELFGKVALPMDRATRPHHFRLLAQKVLGNLSTVDRALLEAYAAGVNTGVAALGEKPFEYLLVRASPARWNPEDSLLIIYAMILDLQDPTNNYERSLATVRDQLGSEALGFFAPLMTPMDAALDGTTAALPPVPGPQVINVREKKAVASIPFRQALSEQFSTAEGELQPGSNSFALSGAHTASGSAMLANDPHLNLGVPTIWYRAVLEWPAVESGAMPRNHIVGVSLPGLPFIALGSNGHVAWGLTDAYADTNDLVAIDVNPVAPNMYKIPGRDDLLEIETHRDTLNVKDGAPEVVESQWTFWGPIVARDFRDRPLAHHWVAYDPAATNLDFIRLESATNVTEAITVAHDSGIPANNFMVADRAGDIAWTIAGKYPKRVGYDGRLPVSWTFGDRRWDGFVPPDQVPIISTANAVKPATSTPAEPTVASTGRLWTANNRVIGGPDLSLLGDGGYAPPARASQIRDRLATLEHATPRDFLAIQLDDRALFLERWQKLLLRVLTPEKVAHKSSRAELRRLVETWEGHASVNSVSYRLVRTFRTAAADLVFMPIFAPCEQAMATFDWHKFNYEPALWTLLEQKPLHLLAPQFATWDDLLLAAADHVVTEINNEGISLDRASWGAHNTAQINHPLGSSLPFRLGHWLNLPNDPLPGDAHMPLIQTPSFGASMRLVVSPGHEHEALFEMPGGQSGHPLSDFYRAGHASWVRGEPIPLLPGETQHTLQLFP
jgi:penicillin amidase